MSNDRPPTDGAAPGEIPWVALEQLAAGELSAEAAKALRTRIDADPTLRSAYAQVEHIEAALRGEPLWQAPLGLTQRVLESVVPRRSSRVATFARVAAAVLVFFSSWIALSGTAPAWADVRRPAPVLESVPSVTPHLELTRSPAVLLDVAAPDALSEASIGAAVPMLAGVLVLAVGMVLLLRAHRRASVVSKGGVR